MRLIIISLFLFLYSKNLYSNEEIFRTLRNDKVNLRQGPSFDYPIKIFYNKKFLPVIILDSSDTFRKIKDHENNTGWVHISQLSKKKAAIIFNKDLILFSKSTIYSNPLAVLKKGRLVKIIKCKSNWCKIKTGKLKGWIKRENLWGLL